MYCTCIILKQNFDTVDYKTNFKVQMYVAKPWHLELSINTNMYLTQKNTYKDVVICH